MADRRLGGDVRPPIVLTVLTGVDYVVSAIRDSRGRRRWSVTALATTVGYRMSPHREPSRRYLALL